MKLETCGAVQYGSSQTDCAVTLSPETGEQMGYVCGACMGMNPPASALPPRTSRQWYQKGTRHYGALAKNL